jgi:hypothetical protein
VERGERWREVERGERRREEERGGERRERRRKEEKGGERRREVRHRERGSNVYVISTTLYRIEKINFFLPNISKYSTTDN